MRLTAKDYTNILSYYKVPKHKNKTLKQKKHLSEKILSEKLCRCIKTIQKTKKYTKESQIIPICKNSVLRKKGLIARKFTCKKKKSVLLSKLKK